MTRTWSGSVGIDQYPLHEYTCVCHACGRVHTVRAYFLSVPTLQFDSNGVRHELPMRGCPECVAEGKIKDAWEALHDEYAWKAWRKNRWVENQP